MQPWWWTPAGWQKPQVLGALLLLLLLQLLSLQLAGCSLADEPPGGAFSNASNSSDTGGIPNPTDGPDLPLQSQTTSSTTFQVLPPTCGFSYERDPTLRDPEAMNRRWPWMVSVRANGVHVCAGILIASRWVLAVAHCLTERANYTVMVGSPWIDQSTSSSSSILVLHVIRNRRFRARRYWSWIGRANNIGLLKLQKKLMYNEYVSPICLPGVDFVLEDSSVCSVTGWGSPQVNGLWPQFLTIHEKEVVILNSKECDDFYHEFSRISSLVRIINSQMICVKDGSREQFCYEASGEPLVCSLEGMWYLVGMMSWGAGCKESEAPPIFLKVSAYQTWIWDSLSKKSLAPPAPSRALLLALPLPLSLLATL